MEEELSSQSAREQRILARRNRIQERIAALKAGETSGDKRVEKADIAGRGLQQVFESKRRLLRLQQTTDLDVSAARVLGDAKEKERRIQDELQRQELRDRLLQEAEQSALQNAAVALQWVNLFGNEVPQDLYLEIQKQQAACNTIIASKDELTAGLKTQLKVKDDEYVRALKQQAEDADTLLQYMSQQLDEMHTAYKQELDEIESAFLQERADLTAANKADMDKLFEQRGTTEQKFMDRYLASAEEYQRLLEELRTADAEDYNVLKIRLETDVQNLEQHLEAMRATYQLNQEKLEYNYRVLVERDAENQSTINQQKRKISRQRDVLSTLKQRYQDCEKKSIDENMRVTDEYKRITEAFRDLQGKFKHFQAADMRRFGKVWAMKQEQMQGLAQQVLQADRLIHEQQLGWQWEEVVTCPGPQRPGGDCLAQTTFLHQAGSRKQLAHAPLDDAVQTSSCEEDCRAPDALDVDTLSHGAGVGQNFAGGRSGSQDMQVWRHTSDVVDEQLFQVWLGLEKNLLRYLELLKARNAGLGQVHTLQQQNDELRTLMSQYMVSAVSEELCIPPVPLMK
ncbi:hypothetical protein WJX72_010361 [[Myrmecia] bisecta]|uniref:Dynein regulatory complex protein 1/2 N-terminal domain-containing protein n=1 Tax=[Myrmecia] bisecta TaxID=41462 RepID=A0AAW1Q515_9CHLO